MGSKRNNGLSGKVIFLQESVQRHRHVPPPVRIPQKDSVILIRILYLCGQFRSGTAAAMKELIEAGKITHWGISEADEDTLRRACKVCPVTAVQNRYSMMYRDYEALFPVLEELQIGFVAFSPLANGFLSAKYNKDSKFAKGTDYRSVMPQFSPEAIDKNQEMLRYLEEIADKKDATPAQISLAWMLAKKPWIVPIPGTRKYGRLLENAQASEVELTDQEVRELDKMLDTVPMSEVFGGSRVKEKK